MNQLHSHHQPQQQDFSSQLPSPPTPLSSFHHGSMSPNESRRHSADVGGLHRAVREGSGGQGWLTGSSDNRQLETDFAELLSKMYNETLRIVEANDAQFNPPELHPEHRQRLLALLDSWDFEPLGMKENELMASVLYIFQALFRIKGMSDAVKIDTSRLSKFLYHIRQLYRLQNHYHNFEHAVDVLQAVHSYLYLAKMVPPLSILLKDADEEGGMWVSTRQPDSARLVTGLTLHDIFALYLAAIGHDVGHPGFNNPFMKNASAPLSQVYNHQSPLEQMHGQLLLRVMRYHGLGVLLDDPASGSHFRKILSKSVLATDMSLHDAFMEEFRTVVRGGCSQQNSSGDNSLHATTRCSRQVLICQALLKNADISNPSRPFHVSQQWASALQKEWASQYKYETLLNIDHSVNPCDEPLQGAKSQVFFTKKIVKPLVDLTAEVIPELEPFSSQCAKNLKEWERILDTLQNEQSAPSTSHSSPDGESSPMRSSSSQTDTPKNVENPASPRLVDQDDYSGAFRLTLPSTPNAGTTISSYAPSIRRQPSGISNISSSPSLSRGSAGGIGAAASAQAMSTRTYSGSSNDSTRISESSSPIDPHAHAQGTHDADVEGDVPNLDDYKFPPPLPPPPPFASPSSWSHPFAPTYEGQLSDDKEEHYAAIRTAGKLGIRKQRSINRNSWCPTTATSSSSSSSIAMSMHSIEQWRGMLPGGLNSDAVMRPPPSSAPMILSSSSTMMSNAPSSLPSGLRQSVSDFSPSEQSQTEGKQDSGSEELEDGKETILVPSGMVSPEVVAAGLPNEPGAPPTEPALEPEGRRGRPPSSPEFTNSPDLDPPKTPPRQTDSDPRNREGSPTPKAKVQEKWKMKETAAQREQRLIREEEERERIRQRLVAEEEKERAAAAAANAKRGGQARSRSKAGKKKGKNRK